MGGKGREGRKGGKKGREKGGRGGEGREGRKVASSLLGGWTTVNSRSFKVIHFGISYKPTRDCMSLLYAISLLCLIILAFSKLTDEIASENAENCRCRQPSAV